MEKYYSNNPIVRIPPSWAFGSIEEIKLQYAEFIQNIRGQIKPLYIALLNAKADEAVAEFKFKNAARKFESKREELKARIASDLQLTDQSAARSKIYQPFTSQWNTALAQNPLKFTNSRESKFYPGLILPSGYWVSVIDTEETRPLSSTVKSYIDSIIEKLRPLARDTYLRQVEYYTEKSMAENAQRDLENLKKQVEGENADYAELLGPVTVSYDKIYEEVKAEVEAERETPKVQAGDVVATEIPLTVEVPKKSKAPLVAGAAALALLLLGNK